MYIIYFVVQLKTLSNMHNAEWENSYVNGRGVDWRGLVLFWSSTCIPKRSGENPEDNGAPELKKRNEDIPRAPNWISGLFPEYQTTLWNEWLALDNNNKMLQARRIHTLSHPSLRPRSDDWNIWQTLVTFRHHAVGTLHSYKYWPLVCKSDKSQMNNTLSFTY